MRSAGALPSLPIASPLDRHFTGFRRKYRTTALAPRGERA